MYDKPLTFFQLAARSSHNLTQFKDVPEPPATLPYDGRAVDIWIAWSLEDQWRVLRMAIERDARGLYRDGNGNLQLMSERYKKPTPEDPWHEEHRRYENRWGDYPESALSSWRLVHNPFREVEKRDESGDTYIDHVSDDPSGEGCRVFAFIGEMTHFRDNSLLADRTRMRGNHRSPTNALCETLIARRHELIVPELDEIIVLKDHWGRKNGPAEDRLTELPPEYRKPGYHKAIKTIVHNGHMPSFDFEWTDTVDPHWYSPGFICRHIPELSRAVAIDNFRSGQPIVSNREGVAL